MNILIVGNGFDLSHYLPTKYDHFMVAMDAIENWDTAKGDMGFDDIFRSLYEKEDYFFGYTKVIYDTDKIALKLDDIKKLQDDLNKNIWYRYFKYYKSKTETWIDLEQKIEEALECCSNFFSLINKKIDEHSKISYLYKELGERAEENVIKLHSRDIHILYLLKILCTKKLISASPVFIWQDIDMPKGGYKLQEDDRRIINNDFVNESAGYLSYNFNNVINYLHGKLEEFIDLFNYYLINFVNSLQLQNKKFKGLECKPDLVYSFNYSDTLERLYLNRKKISYLHGKSEQKNSRLVLGVSDITAEIFKKYKAYGFTKYHQKLLKETEYQFLNENIHFNQMNTFWNQVQEGKRTSTGKEQFVANIYIWGHSLDVSDENYINEIFSFNKKIDEYVRVIVYYFDHQAKFNLLTNLLHILEKDKVETWMKKGWLKFEKNPNIAEINNIQPVELPKIAKA